METLSLTTTGKILDNDDIVTIAIDPVLQIRTFRSYGYGQFQGDGSLTYFDAFDLIDSSLTGYFDDPDEVLTDNEYGYGYGYCYTDVIRQEKDYLTINITISPAGTYNIILQTDGAGQDRTFYDAVHYGYYSSYSSTRYYVHLAQTLSDGTFAAKVWAPFNTKAISYAEYDSESNLTNYKIFDSKGNGLFKFSVTVIDKIIAEEDINATGSLNTNNYSLTINCTGTVS